MAREMVVLMHGILRSKFDMLPLTRFLSRNGYDALNVLYPSRKKNLEDLTDFVHEKITGAPFYAPDKTIHFVVHSMGGLITRYYIARKKPQHLGKVVMLGTPNTGSELADFLNSHKVLGRVYKSAFGPAGQQLTTLYEHNLPPVDFPLGVIAGNISINPIAPFVLPGAHDGIVPVERTRIDGMTDHIVIPTTHTFMMFRPQVMRQVLAFLKNGEFERKTAKAV